MRDMLGFAALVGALVLGVLGMSIWDEGGYMKLLALIFMGGGAGLVLVGLGALGGSRHPGLARAASWLFWILAGLMVLLSLSERFGGG